MQNRKTLTVVRAVIVNPRTAKILVSQNPDHKKHDAGLWGFPGGKLEPPETETEAVALEILGETGTIIQLTGFLMPTINNKPAQQNLSAIITLYMVGKKITDSTADDGHDDKPQNLLWLPPQELSQLPLTASARQVASQITKLKNIADLLKL
ncbi:NUDIX domain-containing protein [Candidatus Kuenenbacteria bacterium]|nr:NUDIX domain-containing protein [Candidatus Kuenenbacteria bacterium]